MTQFMKHMASALGAGAALVTIAGFVMAFVFPDRFGGVVDAIRGTGEEMETAVRDAGVAVTDAVSEVKRETSEDTVKELFNRGYQLKHNDFQRALNAGDQTTLKLFCQETFAPFVDPLEMYFRTEYRAEQMSNDVWEIYKDCPVVRFSDVCSTGKPYSKIPMVCGNDLYEKALQQVCGAREARAMLQEVRDAIAPTSDTCDRY